MKRSIYTNTILALIVEANFLYLELIDNQGNDVDVSGLSYRGLCKSIDDAGGTYPIIKDSTRELQFSFNFDNEGCSQLNNYTTNDVCEKIVMKADFLMKKAKYTNYLEKK